MKCFTISLLYNFSLEENNNNNNNLIPKQNRVYNIINNLPKTWKVSFKINPTTNNNNNQLTNIIHFTTQYDNGIQGSRTPAVWFMPNSRRLKISSSLADNYDHTFEMSEDLPSNTYTEIEIEQFKNQYSSRNGDYIYRITVAGKQVHRVMNEDPREFKNVKMYVSSPWYEPADVVIKDLKLDAPYYEVEQKQGR